MLTFASPAFLREKVHRWIVESGYYHKDNYEGGIVSKKRGRGTDTRTCKNR